MHNELVLKKGKGELVISRRPGEFQVIDFAPCSICYEWMNLKYIDKHHKNTHSETQVETSKRSAMDSTKLQSRKVIQLNADREAGRVRVEEKDSLVGQVLEIMTRDEVKIVAQGDELICALGESWMRRNYGNKKAKYYASQHIRLMAKFLIHLRKLDSPENEVQTQSLWDFLVPSKYDLVVAAAVQLAFPYMDDIEDLRSPSNAIKIKYDILKVINEKWARIQIRETPDPDEAHSCDTFMRLMNIKWTERVTKMARTVLVQRSFNKEVEIPSPDDIKTLTEHICKELPILNLQNYVESTYKRAVVLCQARLVLYNKRRSGEIDYIR